MTTESLIKPLTSTQMSALMRGVRLYNARDFWLAHEVLEGVWRELEGDEARLVQALIQASVCCYHWGNGNFTSSRSLARQVVHKLKDAPEGFADLDLPRFRKEFKGLQRILDDASIDQRPLPPHACPTLHSLL